MPEKSIPCWVGLQTCKNGHRLNFSSTFISKLLTTYKFTEFFSLSCKVATSETECNGHFAPVLLLLAPKMSSFKNPNLFRKSLVCLTVGQTLYHCAFVLHDLPSAHCSDIVICHLSPLSLQFSHIGLCSDLPLLLIFFYSRSFNAVCTSSI